ncbi:MAG TPA: YigZ family protein [Saprospiraceae bacterium]|nr:YigZ family protein [Saprospiraceae bacterium]MCB9327778.1 YigZ family protein [Lewinellaceae bacterium]HPK09527.1 YigZ family protein [Saprospiraceae bacterium]HPQ21689.1 YigZ family protein [Saprospiraceae bacterium]HRX29366.1 YigZ family protein [Saprospiraceae bacterium]
MIDHYYSIAIPSEGEYKEKGSKFLAYLYPFDHESELEFHINALKSLHPKARHYCFAYKIGVQSEIYRINDDGEPSGTAGKPIMGQLNSHNLTNILCIVIRYFGGTKLGVPGLIKAYKDATSDAIEKAAVVEKFIVEEFLFKVDFEYHGIIMNELKHLDIEVIEQSFSNKANLKVKIRKSQSEQKIKQLKATLLGWDIDEIKDETKIDFLEIERAYV